MAQIIIPKEKIISGPAIASSTGSYKHAAPTMNPIYLPSGDLIHGIPTSNNSGWQNRDSGKYGYASPQVDDGVWRGEYHLAPFGSWIDAGANRPPSSFPSVPTIKITPESFIAESFGERKATFYNGDTPLDKFVHDVYTHEWPINKAGEGLYRARELKKWILDYLKTEDGQELVEEMESPDVLGKIKYVGVGRLPRGAIMGVTQMPNGEMLVTMAENASEMLAEDARYYGIDKDSMKRIAISEELIHIVDPRSSELSVKSFKRDHYKRRAAKFSGNPKYQKAEARNKRRAKAIEEDISTMDERYGSRLYQQYGGLYKQDRKSLEMMLELEAYNDGLEGNSAREYVASRIREISKAVEKREISGLEREVNEVSESNDRAKEAKSEPKEAEAANAEASS